MQTLKRNTFLITLTIATICMLAGVFLSAPLPVEAQSDPIADQINNMVPLNTLPPLNEDLTPPDTGQTVNPAYEVQFTTVAKWVYDALVAVGGWINWLGGWLLDVSLSWFVIHMVETTKYFGLDTVVKTVWALFRDLFNLLFIFGLILVGFKLILGVDDSGSKRTLGTIVIAALLINFSLYAAQVVVDLGNILAVEMAKQIRPVDQYQVMGQPVFNFSDSFVSIAHLDNIGSSTLPFAAQMTAGGKEDIPHDKIDVGGALVIGLSVAAMLIVVGFVFAAGAFLMFLRYFYLIFLMMLSPIMVLGLVLPQFRSHGNKWWSTLFKQALVGPAYLMMLYIALLALRTFANVQSTDITTFVLMSLIVSGFAWASLIVAKNIGAMGAAGAMSWGQSWGRSIRGGVTGFAGRNTLGRASSAFQERFNRWQARPEEDQNRMGRWLRRGVAFTNLDQTVTGVTEKGKNARFGGGTSFKQAHDRDEARERRIRTGADEQRNERRVNQTSQNLTQNPIAVTGDQMRDFTNSIRNLTNRQLTEDITFETLTNQNVAIHLSDAQMDTIRNSGRFSNEQIGQLRTAREQGFINLAQGNNGPNNVRNQHRDAAWLGTRSVQQLAQMPAAVFAAPAMAEYITPNIIDARLREGGISDNDLQAIRGNLQLYLNPPVGTARPAGMNTAPPQVVDNWRNWNGRSAFANRLGLNL